jgi:hypothetical protein
VRNNGVEGSYSRPVGPVPRNSEAGGSEVQRALAVGSTSPWMTAILG